MRTFFLKKGEYYMITNRSIGGEIIFKDTEDYTRFTFLLLHLQSPIRIHNSFWYTNSFMKKGDFRIGKDKIDDIVKHRSVTLLAFSILPTCFNIIIENNMDFVASVYMQRILTAYSKYYNSKYKRLGHVFIGPFSSLHIKNKEDLLYKSAYIHKLPSSLSGHENIYDKYLWSSYKDYLTNNRWEKLLYTQLISNYIRNKSYKDIVDSFKI